MHLFINTGKSRKEICDALGIDPKTLYRWVQKGNWEEMKEAVTLTPVALKQQFYGHIFAVNRQIREERENGVPTMEDVEKLRKLMVAQSKIDANSVGMYTQAFSELANLLSLNDINLAKQVVEYCDRIISEASRMADGLGPGLDTAMGFHVNCRIHNKQPVEDTYLSKKIAAHHQAEHDALYPDGQAMSGNEEIVEEEITDSFSEEYEEVEEMPLPDSAFAAHREMQSEDQLRITKDEYEKYRFLLEEPCTDASQRVNFRGRRVARVALEYNLTQYREMGERGAFFPESIVLLWFQYKDKTCCTDEISGSINMMKLMGATYEPEKKEKNKREKKDDRKNT